MLHLCVVAVPSLLVRLGEGLRRQPCVRSFVILSIRAWMRSLASRGSSLFPHAPAPEERARQTPDVSLASSVQAALH